MRSYSAVTRQRMLDAIQRIVRAECQASGSPGNPSSRPRAVPGHRQRPRRHRTGGQAFAAHFGDKRGRNPPADGQRGLQQNPRCRGVPYTYWGLGYTDQKTYLAAEKDGHLDNLTTNHSPKFLPPMQPSLRTGTEALIAAALAWLAP